MPIEKANARDHVDAGVYTETDITEQAKAFGFYKARLWDENGVLLDEDEFHNVVCTVGKNFWLDTMLAGSAYTTTGPFIGLISSASYTTGPVAGDTMASHSGWVEAGNANNPQYTGTRQTPSFSAASGGSKSTSAAVVFVFTNSGTIKGGFLTMGTGAVSTIDNTGGTLWSAGLFTSGDKPVAAGYTLDVTYTTGL